MGVPGRVSVVLALLPKFFLKRWRRRWSRRFALMSALKKMHLALGVPSQGCLAEYLASGIFARPLVVE